NPQVEGAAEGAAGEADRIDTRSVDDGVAALGRVGVEQEAIVAGTADQLVVACPGDERVVEAVARQDVGAGPADHLRNGRGGARGQRQVAVNDLGGGAAHVEGAAGVAAGEADRVDPARVGDRVAAQLLRRVEDVTIVAGAAVEGIVAHAGDEGGVET